MVSGVWVGLLCGGLIGKSASKENIKVLRTGKAKLLLGLIASVGHGAACDFSERRSVLCFDFINKVLAGVSGHVVFFFSHGLGLVCGVGVGCVLLTGTL